jgi:hypothetical protein
MSREQQYAEAELLAAAAERAAAAQKAALVNKVQGWLFAAVVLAFTVLSFVVVR